MGKRGEGETHGSHLKRVRRRGAGPKAVRRKEVEEARKKTERKRRESKQASKPRGTMVVRGHIGGVGVRGACWMKGRGEMRETWWQ